MNQRSDIDRVLQVWMADGPTAIPDRVVDVVATRIGVQRQRRRAWPFQGRTTVTFKLIAALAAALIVAVVGYSLLPKQPGVGSQSPTPIPSPSPTPEPIACEDNLPGCAGPLAAGAHQSSSFAPPFEYVTPAGWENPIDIEGIFALTPVETSPADLILVWSDVVPAAASSDCTTIAKAGASSTVEGWIDYLTTNPGLIASNVHEVTMNKSTVQVVDLERNPTWVSPCTEQQGLQDVPIVKVRPASPGDGYGLSGDVRMRAYIVGVGNATIVVTVYSYDPDAEALAAAVALAEPVVTSFAWVCNSDSPAGPCWGPPDASGNPATPPPT